MDIWEWVGQERKQLQQNGHARLAGIVRAMSSYTCDDKHEQVDAIFPEGLALARALEHNWLELFLRHWNLQSLVLHRLDVSDALHEAVDLLEFAHREENKDCPQSICTTQDIGCTYGYLDGPGYAKERLSVASETLERINPTWPCFTCITTEYSNALRDDGRSEEAEAFLREQIDLMERELPPSTFEYRRNIMLQDLIWAIFDQGKVEEACEMAEKLRSESKTIEEHKRVEHNIMMARIWARMGRVEEALDILPSWDVIQATPSHYLHTARALIDVATHDPSYNTWSIGSKLWMMGDRLERQGVARQALELGMAYTKLAIERKVPHVVARGLELTRRAAAKLRNPQEVEDTLEELEKLTQGVLAGELRVKLPEDLSDVESLLTNSPELDIVVLEEVLKREPQSLLAYSILTDAFRALGWEQEASGIHQRAFEEIPTSEEKLHGLAAWAIPKGDIEFLNTLLSPHLAVEDPLYVTAHWLYALYYREQLGKNSGATTSMMEHLDAILDVSPNALLVRPNKALAMRHQGKWEEAWEMIQDQIQRFGWEDAEANFVWETILVGSVVGQWEEVRRVVSKEFDWELEIADRPILANLGDMKIYIDDTVYWAKQISPVAAYINNLSQPGQTQHYDAMVVFDPATKTRPPSNHPEGEEFIPHASYLATIEESPWGESWDIDGLMPENLRAFKEALRERDLGLYDRSGANYTVTHTTDPSQTRPGYYGLLLALKELTPEQVHERLSQIVEEHGVSLAWPGLASRALATEDAQEMQQFLNEWGIK